MFDRSPDSPHGLPEQFLASDPDSVTMPATPADVLKSYLEAHRTIWDMPSLFEIYPEIGAHLEQRYVADRSGGEAILILNKVDPNHTGERFDIGDVRFVVDILLSREYREALWHERVEPAFARLAS